MVGKKTILSPKVLTIPVGTLGPWYLGHNFNPNHENWLQCTLHKQTSALQPNFMDWVEVAAEICCHGHKVQYPNRGIYHTKWTVWGICTTGYILLRDLMIVWSQSFATVVIQLQIPKMLGYRVWVLSAPCPFPDAQRFKVAWRENSRGYRQSNKFCGDTTPAGRCTHTAFSEAFIVR